MNASEMLDLMNQSPFQGFDIHLNNGTVVTVDHPFSIATRRNAPTFIVYPPDQDGMRIVSYRNVAEVVTKGTTAE